MSGFSTPQSGAAAGSKQISSRLLNMKFMQRAAASTTQKSATSPSTPTSEPAAKRRRTGDFTSTINHLKSPSATSTAPGTPTDGNRITISNTPYSDTNGLSIRRGTNNFDTSGEETEWVLNVRLQGTNGIIQNNGREEEYSNDEQEDEEDSYDDDIWSTGPATAGRQTYGSFKRRSRKPTDSNPGTGASAGMTTPTSTSHQASKRNRPDEDEDLSPLPSSDSEANEDSSEGGIVEPQLSVRSRKDQKRTTPKFDFKSEADLKKMDELDYSKMGFEHGFGKQRPGGRVGSTTAGNVGGGGDGGGGRKQKQKKNKNKKNKNRKTI